MEKYGKLTVKDWIKPGNYLKGVCVCECGNEVVVFRSNLQSGHTKSCGCLNSELSKKRATKHGRYGTREYIVWRNMISRCLNKKDKRYDRYGGRGIMVCNRWLESLLNFYEDMGNRPSGMTLDRIDNDGNYEPNNCRWATPKEQANNKSWNVKMKYNDKKISVLEASELTGIKYSTMLARFRKNWDVEKIMSKKLYP